MAIQPLNDDLDIISKLDPLPNDNQGLTSAEFQAKFDEGVNIIKAYLNSLTPNLYTKQEVDAISANFVMGILAPNSIAGYMLQDKSFSEAKLDDTFLSDLQGSKIWLYNNGGGTF